jgi:hypothetical protein
MVFSCYGCEFLTSWKSFDCSFKPEGLSMLHTALVHKQSDWKPRPGIACSLARLVRLYASVQVVRTTTIVRSIPTSQKIYGPRLHLDARQSPCVLYRSHAKSQSLTLGHRLQVMSSLAGTQTPFSTKSRTSSGVYKSSYVMVFLLWWA